MMNGQSINILGIKFVCWGGTHYDRIWEMMMDGVTVTWVSCGQCRD